jgi:hypothetical protein
VIIIDVWSDIEKVLDRMLLYQHTKECAAVEETIGK